MVNVTLSRLGQQFQCRIVEGENEVSPSNGVMWKAAQRFLKLHRSHVNRLVGADNSCFLVSVEEAGLLFIAGCVKPSSDEEQKAGLEKILRDHLSASPRFAALLFLASTRIMWGDGVCVVPRCDAAAFGAAFACYQQQDDDEDQTAAAAAATVPSPQQSRRKQQEQHSRALVWTLLNNNHDGASPLEPHVHHGITRLAQSVKKEAWLLRVSAVKHHHEKAEEQEAGLGSGILLSQYDFRLERLQ